MPICTNATNRNICEHGKSEQDIDQFKSNQYGINTSTATCLTCRTKQAKYQKKPKVLALYNINDNPRYEDIDTKWFLELVGR